MNVESLPFIFLQLDTLSLIRAQGVGSLWKKIILQNKFIWKGVFLNGLYKLHIPPDPRPEPTPIPSLLSPSYSSLLSPSPSSSPSLTISLSSSPYPSPSSSPPSSPCLSRVYHSISNISNAFSSLSLTPPHSSKVDFKKLCLLKYKQSLGWHFVFEPNQVHILPEDKMTVVNCAEKRKGIGIYLYTQGVTTIKTIGRSEWCHELGHHANYFEVTIYGEVSMGLSSFTPNGEHIGWHNLNYRSIGYHWDDGLPHCNLGRDINLNRIPLQKAPFLPGDVVGCGLIKTDHYKFFFTKNGEIVHEIPVIEQYRDIDFETVLKPIVVLHSKWDRAKFNMGEEPFAFDLLKHLNISI